jgi:hypothetical protein
MNDTKPWINGPYNPENNRDIISSQKETQQKDNLPKNSIKINISKLHKEPWNTGPFYNKSTKLFKQEADFKDANLEGTPFFRDYRIKK